MARGDELIPLHSIEAEMGVLGSMLLSQTAADQVLQILEDKDFYRPSHQMIYRSMRELVRQNRPIDFLTLKSELVARGHLADIGGEDYILQIAEFVPSPANSDYYAQIVMDRSQLRELADAGRQIVGVVHDPDLGDSAEKVDRAEQLVFNVGKRGLGTYFSPISRLAREFFVDVDQVMESKVPLHGLKVGFTDLDNKTTGFYPGDFVIVGGRPAMGKTSLVLDFAINVARKIAREGAERERPGSVAIFSLEMSNIQLARRMASMISGISARVLRSGEELTMDKYNRLSDACEEMYDLPIYIDDASDVSPLEMRGKCRRLKAEYGLDLVIVDYLQLMRGSKRTENRVQEISEIARACKSMAKELEIPVVALSQLSRAVENRDDKRPQLSDIRESGSIEAEADLVMLLYRDTYYKRKEEDDNSPVSLDDVETAEVIIAKHRNGPTGTVKLGFQPAFARYRNLARSYENAE